ncbi:MAG TPA: hypothetical protein VN753_06925 [Terracidiphilus sp.]|nr:hypothetical protein [Terracidiphilus sp.]
MVDRNEVVHYDGRPAGEASNDRRRIRSVDDSVETNTQYGHDKLFREHKKHVQEGSWQTSEDSRTPELFGSDPTSLKS